MSTASAWAQLPFDVAAPVIAHSVAERPGLAGDPQAISATVTDNDSVQSVTLFHRNDTNFVFNQTPMMPSADNIWLTTIDTAIDTERVEYYLTATDAQGNRVQKGTADNPLILRLLVPENTLATAAPSPATSAPQAPPITDADLNTTSSKPNWLLIGLGILALGALAGASGGGGSGSPSTPAPTCCTVTFTAPNASGN